MRRRLYAFTLHWPVAMRWPLNQNLPNDAVPFERCGTLEAATSAAARDAALSEAPEPVVLLSPACASYDQFPNFEARGDRFRALVSEQLAVSEASPHTEGAPA